MTDRYSRQERFAPIGPPGQARLSESSVLIVGVGALGTHSADALARAGVRHLTLVDRDIVEPSNLQRQVLFDEADAAAREPKAVAAAARLQQVRTDLEIHAIVDDFTVRVWDDLPIRPDLILDGSDNHPTRFLINDLAVRDSVPWIYGGAVGSRGAAATIVPGRTPCLRCLIPEGEGAGGDTCETAGVLAPTIQATAAFQAAEALKILSGRTDAVTRGVFQHDLWSGQLAITLPGADRNPDCRSCGTRELPALDRPQLGTTTLCGRNAIQVQPRSAEGLDLDRLEQRLGSGAVADLERNAHMLRFSADDVRFTVFAGGRALLFDVDDENRARALYDRWIGSH